MFLKAYVVFYYVGSLMSQVSVFGNPHPSRFGQLYNAL